MQTTRKQKQYRDTRQHDNQLINIYLTTQSEQERNDAWKLFWEGNENEKGSEGYQKLAHDFVRKQNIVNPDDANDIVSDVKEKVIANLERFKQENPFIPWLKSITENHCKNFNKTAHKQKVENIGWATGPKEQSPAATAYYKEPARTNSPLESAINSQTKIQIINVLNSLPDKDREILMCRHFQHMSYQEISQTLNIKMGTVMSRLYNAKEKFKEAYLALKQ